MDLPPDVILHVAAQSADAPLPATLSDAERQRLETFGSAVRRRTFALGRATLRELLAERLGMTAEGVPLEVAADGAPEVAGHALHVSLAHTATDHQTVAVAAVSPRAIGVDVEAIRPRRPDLYRFILHPDEYGLLDALPHEHDAAQVVLWALKEAVLKAQRSGFRCSPKKLRLSLDPGGHSGIVVVEGGAAWAVRYAEHEGCALAVAYAPEESRQ